MEAAYQTTDQARRLGLSPANLAPSTMTFVPVRKATPAFLRMLVIAAGIFLVTLAVVELAVGSFFVNLVAEKIENRRRAELVESWDRYLNQRKRIHESKVTGYGWWNELAHAIEARNTGYILNDALGGDASLVKEYDVFVAAGKNMETFFAAVDGRTSVADPDFVRKARDLDLERLFYAATSAKLLEMRPAYLANVVNAAHKHSLDAPIVWHHITRYNGSIRLLTVSPISINEGYPYTQGYLLFGYSMKKVIDLAQDIIPARIALQETRPTRAYAVVPINGLRKDERFFLTLEPKFLVAESARRTMYLLILVQVTLGLFVFMVVAPGFARRYSRELEETVEARTIQLSHANNELEKRQEQIARELKMARIVQQNLLPDAEYQRGRLRVSCLYRPVHDLGGDLYDVTDLGDGRLGVLVADVAGHGVPAALVSMMVKLSFVNNARAALPPDETLRLMNQDLNPLLAEGDYLTAAYAIFRPDNGEVHFSVGGHRAPIHYRREQAVAVELNEALGPLIGPFVTAQFQAFLAFLAAGDRLFLFSDGLVEQKNPLQEQYGTKRLLAQIELSGTLRIAEARERILSDLEAFKGTESFTDDITLVVVELFDTEPLAALRVAAGAAVPNQN